MKRILVGMAAVTAVVASTLVATAVPAQAADCPPNALCVWEGSGFSGRKWVQPAGGYQDIGGNIRIHSVANYTGANGCLIDWIEGGGRVPHNVGPNWESGDLGHYGVQTDAIQVPC